MYCSLKSNSYFLQQAVIEMRCRELGNYLTKCLDIPAVSDDTDFRTFLGFPSNFMHLKARAFSVMPEAIDHGEAGDGEEDIEGSSDDEAHHDSSKPPTLVAPPDDTASSPSKPALPSRPNAPTAKQTGISSNSDSAASPSQNPSSNNLPHNHAFAGLVPPADEDGIAMFDYAGSEASELAFSVGEIVHMIESNAPADWAAGFTDKSTADKPGYFPRSFVRPFTSEDYVYNSALKTWSLRDDIANFTYDPVAMTYHYTNPPRAPAQTLYK